MFEAKHSQGHYLAFKGGSLTEFNQWLADLIVKETLLRSHIALAKWSKK